MQIQDDVSLSPMILPLGLQSFRFPQVSTADDEPSAVESARILWPECVHRPMHTAAEEVAEGIRWRLPKTPSAILAFTSPLDTDEKDKALLAIVPELARRSNGEILAVDADPGDHALTRHLRFAGPAPTGNTLVLPSNVPHLNVLSLLRQSQAIKPDWIEDWRERWRLVVIHAPSLEHRRAGQLTRLCDGTYLIVRLHQTSRRAVRESAEVIRAHGGRLLGCIAVQ